MKSSIAICVLLFMALAHAQYGGTSSLYTDQYDNIDMGQVVFVSRRLMPYVECIIDQGKCSPPTKEMQNNVRAAMERECNQCPSETRRFLKHDEENGDSEMYLNYIVPIDDSLQNSIYEKQLSEKGH